MRDASKFEDKDASAQKIRCTTFSTVPAGDTPKNHFRCFLRRPFGILGDRWFESDGSRITRLSTTECFDTAGNGAVWGLDAKRIPHSQKNDWALYRFAHNEVRDASYRANGRSRLIQSGDNEKWLEDVFLSRTNSLEKILKRVLKLQLDSRRFLYVPDSAGEVLGRVPRERYHCSRTEYEVEALARARFLNGQETNYLPSLVCPPPLSEEKVQEGIVNIFSVDWRAKFKHEDLESAVRGCGIRPERDCSSATSEGCGLYLDALSKPSSTAPTMHLYSDEETEDILITYFLASQT